MTGTAQPDAMEAAMARVAEELTCPICLETAQMPCNLTCFRGCGGTSAGSCLRSAVCAHCANDALQLGKPPSARFPDAAPPGFAHCLVCRETRVDARMLSPDSAFSPNFNVAAIMDALGMGATCRRCEQEFPSQAALAQHYQRACPAAVLRCRYKGCSHWHPRSAAREHEEACSVGRAACGQCGAWVERADVLRHMVSACRLRVVHCVLCKHTAPLPDMLEHLRLHQNQLQASSAVSSVLAGVAAAGAAAGPGGGGRGSGSDSSGAGGGSRSGEGSGSGAPAPAPAATAAAAQPGAEAASSPVAAAAAALAALHQQLAGQQRQLVRDLQVGAGGEAPPGAGPAGGRAQPPPPRTPPQTPPQEVTAPSQQRSSDLSHQLLRLQAIAHLHTRHTQLQQESARQASAQAAPLALPALGQAQAGRAGPSTQAPPRAGQLVPLQDAQQAAIQGLGGRAGGAGGGLVPTQPSSGLHRALRAQLAPIVEQLAQRQAQQQQAQQQQAQAQQQQQQAATHEQRQAQQAQQQGGAGARWAVATPQPPPAAPTTAADVTSWGAPSGAARTRNAQHVPAELGGAGPATHARDLSPRSARPATRSTHPILAPDAAGNGVELPRVVQRITFSAPGPDAAGTSGARVPWREQARGGTAVHYEASGGNLYPEDFSSRIARRGAFWGELEASAGGARDEEAAAATAAAAAAAESARLARAADTIVRASAAVAQQRSGMGREMSAALLAAGLAGVSGQSIRRSFSDTQLIHDVVEELVRASNYASAATPRPPSASSTSGG